MGAEWTVNTKRNYKVEAAEGNKSVRISGNGKHRAVILDGDEYWMIRDDDKTIKLTMRYEEGMLPYDEMIISVVVKAGKSGSGMGTIEGRELPYDEYTLDLGFVKIIKRFYMDGGNVSFIEDLRTIDV